MGTRKVGHAGTLDPMATGVLVLGIERATKLLGHLALDTKTYLATIRLGLATDTDDAEGEPIGDPVDAAGIGDDAVAEGVAALTGRDRSRCRAACRRSRSTAAGPTSAPAPARRSASTPGR